MEMVKPLSVSISPRICRVELLCCLFVCVGVGVTHSQELPMSRSNKKVSLVNNLCASYGEGYVAIAGTSTCIKVSGHVRVEVQGQNTANSLVPGGTEQAYSSSSSTATTAFGQMKAKKDH